MDDSSIPGEVMGTNATTVSQDLKDLQDGFLPRHGLDLLLKYSALLIAAAYLSGFTYFTSLLRFLRPGHFPIIYPISTPVVLTEGTFCLGLYLIGLFIVFLPILFKFQRWSWWVLAVPSMAIFALVDINTVFGTNWILSGMPFLPLLMSGYIGWRYHRRPTAERYYQAVAYVALGLILFSGILGFLRTRGQREWPKARFLVSPEAKIGARELGIEFFLPQKASTEPELSVPVTILIENDKTYLLRTDNGEVVELAKDKVWGTQW